MTENNAYEITDEQLEVFRKEVQAIGFKILSAIQDGKDVYVNNVLIVAVGDIIEDDEACDPETGNPYGLKLFRRALHNLERVEFYPWYDDAEVREVVVTDTINKRKIND